MNNRIYNAIVLVDEPGDPSKHYATMVKEQIKTIETRMRNIIPEGAIVICCGAKSMTKNRLKALCIVFANQGRPMTEADEKKACIECVPGRIAYDLMWWKYFSRDFEFSKCKVSGTFQGIFKIAIPDDVEILDARP